MRPVYFGQLIIGPPGSGKTTYCQHMKVYLKHIGRNTVVINLDPANDCLSTIITFDVNVRDLVTLEDAMHFELLGPNGGLLHCVEYIEKNYDWLADKIRAFSSPDTYLLFDCPGQVELYTHNGGMKNLIAKLVGKSKCLKKAKPEGDDNNPMDALDLRLCAMQLIDSHYCNDPAKFISAVCYSLSSSLHLALPVVHVLSKADLLEHRKLSFHLDFYSEVLDLRHLLDRLKIQHSNYEKYRSLHETLIGVIEDRSLVTFSFLSVAMKETMECILKLSDKANGYVYGIFQEERSYMKLLMSQPGSFSVSDKIEQVERLMTLEQESGPVNDLPDPKILVSEDLDIFE